MHLAIPPPNSRPIFHHRSLIAPCQHGSWWKLCLFIVSVVSALCVQGILTSSALLFANDAAPATAGALAELPARGLAAAISEAGRIEVPTSDPHQTMVIHATQASRWTEGAYDVWHLTGGATVTQGETQASAYEAVLWVEQEHEHDSRPSANDQSIRTVVVRMAGDVKLQCGGDANAQVRGSRWAGR